MFGLKSLIIACSLFSIGYSKFDLPKCSIYNEGCLKFLHQSFILNAKNGIKELNFPPLDPLIFKDVSVQILDTLTGSFENGALEGINTCVFNKFQIDLQKQVLLNDITCDIKLKGTVKLAGSNPAIEAVLGTSSVNAEGKGSLKLDKLNIKFEAPFSLLKNPAGDVYLQADSKATNYEFDLPNAFFEADKIIIGNQDISYIGANYLNQNYKHFIKDYGKIFLSTGVFAYFDVANQFFASVPISKYVFEDLSSSAGFQFY